MKRSKSQDLFVIFAFPEQHGRPGTRYYADDGTITTMKSKAAKFLTFEDAKEFANEKNIELSAVRYIGLQSFSASELSMC